MRSIVAATILKDRITFTTQDLAITPAHTAKALRAVTLTGSARKPMMESIGGNEPAGK
jgi:hypothetical protein